MAHLPHSRLSIQLKLITLVALATCSAFLLSAELQASPLCSSLGLCTCYNTVDPPACYHPNDFSCVDGVKLVRSPEPAEACAIPDSIPADPELTSLTTSDTQPAVSNNYPLNRASRVVWNNIPTSVKSRTPRTRSSSRPAAAMDADCGSLGNLGELVAPVKGTLIKTSSTVQDSPIPFKTVSNKYTSPIIRLPTAAESDPHGLRNRPFPTSAWFTNLLWGGPQQQSTYGEDPVQVFPYHVRALGYPNPNTPPADRGLWFCKPFYTGDNDGGVIFATFPELQLTLKEMQDSNKPLIQAVNWDDLSITMKFMAGAESAAHMEVPLVKGSPYLTALIPTAAHPILMAPKPGDGGAVIHTAEQLGPNKLKIVMHQVPSENQHTWLLWASTPIKYTFANNQIAISDVQPAAGAPEGSFSGVLRLAILPDAANSKEIETMLDSYVDTFPTGGTVKVWSNMGDTSESSVGSYSLTWSTQSMSSRQSTEFSNPEVAAFSGQHGSQAQAPAELLMLALPHHMDTLASPKATLPATATSQMKASSPFPLGVAAPTAQPTSSDISLTYTPQNKQPPHSIQHPSGGNSTSGEALSAYLMSVRGPMIPVVGSCWLLQEQLVPLETEMDAAVELKNAKWRKDIEQTLLEDIPLVIPTPDLGEDIFADWPGGQRAWPWKGMMNTDAYFGGSELHAMAKLINVARALEKTAPSAGSNFAQEASAAASRVTDALKQLLLHRLSLPCDSEAENGGANPGALCYDDVFKLVTTARALIHPTDDAVDFFSRTGTDHHFHWGYWVAAAATIASEDLSWYQQHLEPYITALLRDFANNDKSDPSFVFARHKDWYMGHSWAAGLQLSADGKNQESSSEAVNGYRAVALLGSATGNKVLEGWGRLLMTQEINAARKYTQVHKKNDIYQLITGSDKNGITQAKVATILFAAKASAYNWFDPDILTRHAIQWMPFSPASNELLPVAWLEETVPFILENTKVPTDKYWKPDDGGGGAALGWRVLLLMGQSILPGQQTTAWNSLQQLPLDGSDGYALCGTIGRMTRTYVKWWIATRPSN